jgi:Tol biopolymer transport system component
MTERSTRRLVWGGCVLSGLLWVPVHSPAAFPGANGKISFSTNRDGNAAIYVMNPDGSNQLNLCQNFNLTIADSAPVWSPDGGQIAFQSQRASYPSGIYDIYVMPADCSSIARRTVSTGYQNFGPGWSSDGSQIVFFTDRDGNFEIYKMNADGSGPTRLTSNPTYDEAPEWSPVGNKIAFASDRDGNFEIYVMSADGSGQTRLTNNPAPDNHPSWSPDGTKIAFNRGGNYGDIYVINADGTNETRLTFGAYAEYPAWSPDGSQMVYVSLKDTPGRYQIWVMNADGSGQTRLTNNSASESTPDWQPAFATDSTPPVITPTISGPLGFNGWHVGAVTVSWTVTDPESPITSTSGCGTILLSADTEGTMLTCTATSGGGMAYQSVTVKIDQTAPMVSPSRSPAPNAAGWNNTNVTVTFSCADSLSGMGSVTGPLVVSNEGANQWVTGVCQDMAGNSATATQTGINIDKTPPVISNVVLTPNPAPVNTAVTLSASATDANLASVQYAIDSAAPVSVPPAALISASIGTFTATGVFTICVSAQDLAGNGSAVECALFPVYDPNGGFVTGGGWIDSPPGAYTADASLTGKATFGFVSKYQKGATVPSGNTQFQFRAAALSFKSTAYDWLVIAGAKAQYKGTGTINGAGSYTFLLTAVDGDQAGGGGVDRFRLKITGASGLVYDNQAGASDTADFTTAIGGGSIVIHPQ